VQPQTMTEQGAERTSPIQLAQTFADLSRTLSGLDGEKATLEAVVNAALKAIPGAEAAGITVLRGENFRTVAPTDELVNRVDAIQYELRSGPCVDAIIEDTNFCTGDLERDERWPTFGKRVAAEVGVRSMIGLRLFFGNSEDSAETIGSLNLYARKLDAFTETSTVLGTIFATHAALALSSARADEQRENLSLAQESNREIGMAMGILMSRHALTQSQAFDLLRVASQHTHRKLRQIACDVVETGMLDFPTPAS
jgi:GAF domain-containing protein